MKLEKRYHDEEQELFERCCQRAKERLAAMTPEEREAEDQKNHEMIQQMIAESEAEQAARVIPEQTRKRAERKFRALARLVDRVARMNDMNFTMELCSDLHALVVMDSDLVILRRDEARYLTEKLLKRADEVELMAHDGLARLMLEFDLTL